MESTFISPYRDDIIISWPELHRDTRVLCRALIEKGPFKGIIAVARGGMIPAALVAREPLFLSTALPCFGLGAVFLGKSRQP